MNHYLNLESYMQTNTFYSFKLITSWGKAQLKQQMLKTTIKHFVDSTQKLTN